MVGRQALKIEFLKGALRNTFGAARLGVFARQCQHRASRSQAHVVPPETFAASMLMLKRNPDADKRKATTVFFERRNRGSGSRDMQYPGGQVAHRSDKVRLWSGTVGTVVCSLDTHEFSDEHPRNQWSYLRRGVLIHSAQTGLIHYLEPEVTFQLIERGSMLA